MYKKLSKFLRIFFMCHCRPDRSFFYKGHQFPICARCTGQLIGLFIGIVILIIIKNMSWIYILLLSMPLILDGFIQLLTSYTSNNFKRLISGILFGIAIIFVFAKIHYFTFELALKFVSIFQPNNPMVIKYLN